MKCKNCKFWEDGYCDGIGARDEGYGSYWEQNPAIAFDIVVEVSDDTGLNVRLKTGPDFGCIRFKKGISNE